MRRFNIIQALFVLLLIAAKGNASAGQSGYEYWFDGEYDRKSVSIMESDSVAIDIDIRGLQSGLHFFNLRAWNDKDNPGMLYRTLFFINEPMNDGALGYEYWIDDNEHVQYDMHVSSAEILIDHEIDSLSCGRHTFSFRAKNSAGVWGEVYSEEFEVDKFDFIDNLTVNSGEFTVYDLNGVLILSSGSKNDLDMLPKGIYIINGRKIFLAR